MKAKNGNSKTSLISRQNLYFYLLYLFMRLQYFPLTAYEVRSIKNISISLRAELNSSGFATGSRSMVTQPYRHIVILRQAKFVKILRKYFTQDSSCKQSN
jgi:hypothetical protein